MVHVGASDSSWQRDRKEERQSERVTMKDHAGLHLSKFFSCGLVILQKKKGAKNLLGSLRVGASCKILLKGLIVS